MPNDNGRCGICGRWEFIGNEWGICKSATENSDNRGVVLTGVDAELQVRKDHYCKLFEMISIFRA